MDPDEKMKGKVKGDKGTSKSPLWFKEAIIYHILIDRFAGYDSSLDWKKPAFMGGSFAGIREKLEYLTDLGVNTLWLSPVNAGTAYHGYHITDFFTTDIHFGTEEALNELLQAAHQRNLRVILDFVPNHCSHQHPFFVQAFQDSQSRYRQWFYFSRMGNSYKSFLHFKELPKFNLENKDAASSIFIKKKPLGMEVTPEVATYRAKYREQDGKSFFTYSRAEVKFKVNWKRKLFHTYYTTMSEMAITDRTNEEVIKFAGKEKLRYTDVFSEKVEAFTDPDFWGDYNVIEPDQSIESAIRRLSRKLKFSDRKEE